MMNSKELIKKIDIGRVGNGSVSYNDMCLILNKEETLEHLQYIEQLEKENQELKEKLDGIPLEYDGYLYFTKSISNVVKENKKLKKALDILKNKLFICAKSVSIIIIFALKCCFCASICAFLIWSIMLSIIF